MDASEAGKFFEPNGKSEEFIKMVGAKGEEHPFVNMFVGANGTTKTATGVNILLNIVYGVQNKYFDHELFRNFPYIKRARIISDPTTLKEKIIPEIRKWFPKSDVSQLPEAPFEEKKEGKFYTSKIVTNTGWTIDFMSNEQDVKEFESVDLGFVWFDEPPPQSVFNATVFRGRAGMIIVMTYTPLFHSGWLKDWLDDHADGAYADYVEAELEDNCTKHGVRGLLRHRDIMRMAEAVPEDEKEARVFGKFGHLIGRVHKKFKHKIHVIKAFPITEKEFTVYQAIDPHPRTPDHVLYLAVDRRDQWYVAGEIVHDGTTKDLAFRMRDFEKNMRFRVETRLIDPSAFIDDRHMEQESVGKQLSDLGFSFIKGSKDLDAGIRALDNALDYDIQNGQWVRQPKILFMDTCPVAIKQIEQYVWDNYVGRSADEKQAKPKPKDKDDHMPENLHRLAMFMPRFVKMTQYFDDQKVINQRAEEAERMLDPYYERKLI